MGYERNEQDTMGPNRIGQDMKGRDRMEYRLRWDEDTLGC